MSRALVRGTFTLIAGGIVLLACGVGTDGLGPVLPDDAATPEGSMDPGFADGSGVAGDSSIEGSTAEASPPYEPPETASPVADATDGIVDVGADSTTTGRSDAGDATADADDATGSGDEASTDATADRNEAASDASADVGATPEASGMDSAASDAGSDASACVLPTGATTCCGSVPCTDHGGSCSTTGICAKCMVTCNSTTPICCALGGTTIKCEVKVTDC